MSDTAPRWEDRVQVSLMLAVGGVAAAASWAHVVSLASGHGQPGWLSYADAAVIETAAVSSGLEVRRRRRTRQSTVFPLSTLVVAVVLSLAAQVAEAERSVWGWVMAAVPAVGFLVLVKIAVSRTVVRPEGDRNGQAEHDQRQGLREAAGTGSEDAAGAAVRPEGDRAAEGQRTLAASAVVVLADEPGWRLVARAHGVSEAAAKKRVERGYGGLSGTQVVDEARAVLANGHVQ